MKAVLKEIEGARASEVELAKIILGFARDHRELVDEANLEEIFKKAFPEGLDVIKINSLKGEMANLLPEVAPGEKEIAEIEHLINSKYRVHFYPESESEEVVEAETTGVASHEIISPSTTEEIKKYKQNQYRPNKESREVLARMMLDSWLEKNPFSEDGRDLTSVTQLLKAAYPDPNPDAEVRIMALIFDLAKEDKYNSLVAGIRANINGLISLLKLDEVHDSALVQNMFLSARELGFCQDASALLGFVQSTKFNCLKKVGFAKKALGESDLASFLSEGGFAKYSAEFPATISSIELYNCLYLSGRIDELAPFVKKEFVEKLVADFSPEKQLSTSSQEMEAFEKLTSQTFVPSRHLFAKAATFCEYFARKIDDRKLSEEEINNLEIGRSPEGGDEHLPYEDVLKKLQQLLRKENPADEDILSFFNLICFAPLNEDNQRKIIAFWKSDKNIIARSLQKEGGLLNFSNGLTGISNGCAQNIGDFIRRVLIASNLGKDVVDNAVFACFYDQVVAGILNSGGDVMDEYSSFENPAVKDALISLDIFQQNLSRVFGGAGSYNFVIGKIGSIEDESTLSHKWFSKFEDMPDEEGIKKIAAYLALKEMKERGDEFGDEFKDYEISLEGLPEDFKEYVKSPKQTDPSFSAAESVATTPPCTIRISAATKRTGALVDLFEKIINAANRP